MTTPVAARPTPMPKSATNGRLATTGEYSLEKNGAMTAKSRPSTPPMTIAITSAVAMSCSRRPA